MNYEEKNKTTPPTLLSGALRKENSSQQFFPNQRIYHHHRRLHTQWIFNSWTLLINLSTHCYRRKKCHFNHSSIDKKKLNVHDAPCLREKICLKYLNSTHGLLLCQISMRLNLLKVDKNPMRLNSIIRTWCKSHILHPPIAISHIRILQIKVQNCTLTNN